MPTQADVVSNLIAVLSTREPDIDLGIGSVVRKVLDAVGGEVERLGLDRFLLSYGYDIDQKSGADLDDFVQLFGMLRKQPTRARGVVTFSRSTSIAKTKQVTIPVGTLVVAPGAPTVTAATTVTAVLPLNQLSVDVPVVASFAGPAGNVGASKVATTSATIDGVTVVNNTTSLSGGLAAESDQALRDRWRKHRFRNLAGTEAMYSALAQQARASDGSYVVTKVSVLGSKRTQSEQVAISDGAASSMLATAAYVYPDSVFLGPDISGGAIAVPGTDYNVDVDNAVVPAEVDLLVIGTRLAAGIYELEYDYVSIDSRNDPAANRFNSQTSITNRIDIWVNGESLQGATQACQFTPTAANTFNADPTSPLYTQGFVLPNGTRPAVGDIITPLGFGPVVDLPDTLSVGGTVYHIDTDYALVNRDDAFGYAPQSTTGICWRASGASPPVATDFTVQYLYNEIPAIVQLLINLRGRLLGTDVWVHAGRARRYRVNLAVVYDRVADRSIVDLAIEAALGAFMADFGFGSALQISDLTQVVHNVTGVDNVRLLTSADDANFGLQVRRSDGTLRPPAATGGRSRDVQFGDSEYPVLDSVRIIPKAANTFGVA